MVKFSPINEESSVIVDVTGDSVEDIDEIDAIDERSKTIGERLSMINPNFGSFDGDPFDAECSSEDEDSERSSDDKEGQDCDEVRSEDLSHEMSLHDDKEGQDYDEVRSEDLSHEMSLYVATAEDEGCKSISSSSIPHVDKTSNDEHRSEEFYHEMSVPDISESLSDSRTFTAMEIEPEDLSDSESNLESSSHDIVLGPPDHEQHIGNMKRKLEGVFERLVGCSEDVVQYTAMFESERVVVEVNKVEELLNDICSVEGCGHVRKILEKVVVGGVLSISYACSGGHNGTWTSSSILGHKKNQKLFVTPVVMAASVLVSGNNFDKVDTMMKLMNCKFISVTTFSRLHESLYIVPAINDLWEQMKEEIWNTYAQEPLVMSGDGRMDSPGFSAKYCVYTIMDHFINVIMDVEIVDKREAGGASTVMEKIGLKRLLERMMVKLNLYIRSFMRL